MPWARFWATIWSNSLVTLHCNSNGKSKIYWAAILLCPRSRLESCFSGLVWRQLSSCFLPVSYFLPLPFCYKTRSCQPLRSASPVFRSKQERARERRNLFWHRTRFLKAFLKILARRGTSVVGFFPRHQLLQSTPAQISGSRLKSSVFQPLKSAGIMDRRTSQNSSNSPLRVSPSSSLGGLTNGDRKKPFLIGVAGGTASGKVGPLVGLT